MENVEIREWVVEHSWTCGSCSHVNLARLDKCEQCGQAKTTEDLEQVPADMSYENRVTDTSRFDSGLPDWICSYCPSGTRNPASVSKCQECGSSKEEKEGEYGEKEIDTPSPVVVDSITVNNNQPHFQKLVPTSSNLHYSPIVPNNTEEGPARFWYLLLLVVVIAVIAYGCVWYYSWHPMTATVAETTWTYHVELLERQVNSGRSWRDQEPVYSYNEVCHSEIRSYHNCNPYSCRPHQQGFRCNCQTITHCRPTRSCRTACSNSRNGSSQCREVCSTSTSCSSSTSCNTCYRTVYDTCYQRCPDYDQMCTYNYPTWTPRLVSTLVGHDHTLIRPNLSAPNNLVCGTSPENHFLHTGASQCTTDTITYHATLNAGNLGRFEYAPSSLSEYNRFLVGSTWSAEYNHAGDFRPLHPTSERH